MNSLKIAVPVTKDQEVDHHFGHCEFYQIFTVSETQEITDIETLKSPSGCGCKSNISNVLAQKGVKTMLAGNMGLGAVNVLNQAGIEVKRGCSGNARELVKQFNAGIIKDSGSSCTEHECNH